MKKDAIQQSAPREGDPRPPYEKPAVQRVELALDETLSGGCKLGTDAECVGPPITVSEAGS